MSRTQLKSFVDNILSDHSFHVLSNRRPFQPASTGLTITVIAPSDGLPSVLQVNQNSIEPLGCHVCSVLKRV